MQTDVPGPALEYEPSPVTLYHRGDSHDLDFQYKTEGLANDLVLVQPEALKLRDDEEISPELWLPLLGGELMPMWTELLANPGDELIIKGSTVTRMLLGAWVYDKVTGVAPSALRSDIDVITTSASVETCLAGLDLPKTKTAVSTKVRIGDLDVGFISQETIEAQLADAAVVLEQIVNGLPEEHNKVREWLNEKIVTLREIHGGRATNEKDDSYQESRSVLSNDSMFDHEAIAVRLRRGDDNTLHAYLMDANGVLEQPMVRLQLSRQAELGEHFGLMFENPNVESVKWVYVYALQYVKEARFSNLVPLYVLESIPRMMRAAAELDVELYSDGMREYPYMELFTLARQIVTGETHFRVDVARNGEVIEVDSGEYYKTKVIQAFARSCASNFIQGVQYMTTQMPHAPLIHEKLGEFFGEYHENVPPNNVLLAVLDRIHPFAKELPVVDIPPIRATMKFWYLEAKMYGCRFEQMGGVGSERSAGQRYAEHETEVSGMSEVMGLLLASVGWDPENDRSSIEEIIVNWQPKGKVKGVWKTKDMDFDTDLDLKTILKTMVTCQAVLERAKEEYDDHVKRSL